jgi:SOS response regulatory protein OraA/RecX
MVLYDYDTNAILTEPLKNCTGPKSFRAYQKLQQYLVSRGFTPLTHWLDNEASTALNDYNRA